MNGAIASAASGLRAAETQLTVTAHDLAAWSSGHAAVPSAPDADGSGAPVDRRVVLRETSPGVAADVIAADRAVTGIDEAVELITTPRAVQADAAVIRTAVAAYESVIGLVPRGPGSPTSSATDAGGKVRAS